MWLRYQLGCLIAALLLSALFPSPISAQTPLPAFPGAEGSAAITPGGRGGKVLIVTTLEDVINANDGVLSLREAVNEKGPRIITFAVGGTITLNSQLMIQQPFVTIAGQTAPGGGILLDGHLTCNPFRINTHDVVIRYLRIRVGQGTKTSCNQSGDAISIYHGVKRVIVDHMSLSWSGDETFQVWANFYTPTFDGVDDITLQWSILAEALKAHSTNLITGASNSTTSASVRDLDAHHNLLMNTSHRQPLVKTPIFRFTNNIVYNWSYYASQSTGGVSWDVISNLYKPGPLSPKIGTSRSHEIQVALPGNTLGEPSVYAAGNIGPNNPSPQADNWNLMVRQITGENGAEIATLSTQYRRNQPLPALPIPITVTPADQLEAKLLPTVGASQRLDCQGNWVANPDSVDVRLLNEYRSGTGKIPVHENDVGGFPVIAGGTACADSDQDGAPDEWETKYNFDKNLATDQSLDADADGYTNIEEFLNGTSPRGSAPASPSSCAGDVNGDRVVNLSDYSVLVRNFLKAGAQILDAGADLNQDGQVNLVDYSMLVTNFLRSC